MATPVMSDELVAQLLEMGFEPNLVTACQVSMGSSNTPVTLQSATEWILQQMSSGQTTPQATAAAAPTLRLGGTTAAADVPHISQPLSSGSALTHHSEPLRSRYDLGDEKRKQKEALIAKERDDALKKARERRLADMKAKAIVKQKIEEDRLNRLERAGTKSKNEPVKKLHVASSTNQCRVQVRLPNGNVLRHIFPVEATLNDVCQYITQNNPRLTNILLVQPFPHKDFSSEEHSQSLQSLGLCPSASLVVSKSTREQLQQRPLIPPVSNEDEDKMDTSAPIVDQDNDGSAPLPPPLPRGILPPRGIPPGGILPPPGGFPPGGIFPPPGGIFPGHRIGMAFEGEGRRLGGREVPVKFGDANNISKSARDAAEERAKVLSKMASEEKSQPSFGQVSFDQFTGSKLSTDVIKLEVSCLRTLARWSSVDWLPNCSNLPPRVAQRLLSALIEAKQLHPKTLNVFLKCPLQYITLDNYCYATNQLIEMFRYFPTLTHLSLVSCTLITDKSVSQLLSYLPQLYHLNLSGCHQLSDDIFEFFKGYNNLNVIKLSHLKLTDTGVMYLLRHPLQNLEEVDLSFTAVTTTSLNRLGQNAPNIKILNIESTKVSNIDFLLQLKHLHTLNISQCLLNGKLSTLGSCVSLRNLSLSGIIVDSSQLKLLSGLKLSSLALPDRNFFFDEHMEVISGFPLESLNLTGYCNVTDEGIKYISRMSTLTSLSLSRTHLTDEGMIFLEGLYNLKQLTLDNTHITDIGMMSISGLDQLEDLSVSDTKITSKFILDGALSHLFKLSKLNLVRTFVDDQGLLSLNLPSLQMLNIDWTCVSSKVTIETLQEKGCRSLETLRNRNIGQMTLEQKLSQQSGGGLGLGVAAPPLINDNMEEDDSDSDSD